MKDYKKILGGVVDIINTTEKSDIGFANICAYIGENCPELKESEDERIRKELINYFSDFHLQTFADLNPKKILAWLEKQYADPIKEYWRGYNEGKQCVLDKYAELEKQGEQKLFDYEKAHIQQNDFAPKSALEAIKEEKVDNANKIEPKFKVKYAGSEYNVFEIKDIAGVIFYGIEDEPNHIDYVKADNCEIISGYGFKESGLSFPTKPVMFSEQKFSWSEEDEKMCQETIDWFEKKCFPYALESENPARESIKWLKSLKERYNWKPSDEQIKAIKWVIDGDNPENWSITLKNLYQDLKKLKG